jgi:hypothetical protein
MTVPYILANGVGNYPDADKFMANYSFLEGLIGGNLLGDPGFEDWNIETSFAGIGTDSAINDYWIFAKAGGTPPTVTIAREGTTKHTGSYSLSLEVTGAGSGDSYARVYQEAAKPDRLANQTMIFGAEVYASTSNKVRLAIYDGTTTSYSSYHSGTPGWEKLSVQYTLPASPSRLVVWLEVNPSDFTGTVYLDSTYLYVVPSAINSAAVAQLDFSSRIMRHLLSLETHAGAIDGITYLLGKLFGGGGSAFVAIKTQTTVSVSTSAKTIITAGTSYGAFALVVGDDATNFFADIVWFSYGGTPQVVASKTMLGAPAARTYSNTGTGGINQLTMGSGTYDIQVLCLDMTGR